MRKGDMRTTPSQPLPQAARAGSSGGLGPAVAWDLQMPKPESTGTEGQRPPRGSGVLRPRRRGPSFSVPEEQHGARQTQWPWGPCRTALQSSGSPVLRGVRWWRDMLRCQERVHSYFLHPFTLSTDTTEGKCFGSAQDTEAASAECEDVVPWQHGLQPHCREWPGQWVRGLGRPTGGSLCFFFLSNVKTRQPPDNHHGFDRMVPEASEAFLPTSSSRRTGKPPPLRWHPVHSTNQSDKGNQGTPA